MNRWAYALEDDNFAQLTPVENLPFKWLGPTASFHDADGNPFDPTTVKDCWWSEIAYTNGHHQFTYRKTSGKEKGCDWIFDDQFIFFTSDEQMRTYWQEGQITPRDLKALWQDFYFYGKKGDSNA